MVPHLFTMGQRACAQIIVTENGRSYRRFGWKQTPIQPNTPNFYKASAGGKILYAKKNLLDKCLFHISDRR
ncbi:MAG: hypothetical protein ACLR56_03250 [Oscillospiraceae bacterium]